ncbi:MAG: hypothetical protein PWP70_1509 [Moorella sp. (in: firmicutes)]|nr:hypothetical protein [Moorella sp. (in: firmicutes)]
MREWKAVDIEKQIAAQMPEINRRIIRSRSERVTRRRPRDPEEQEILDRLCIYKWQRSVADGKVKILSKREWYYEFD